MNMVQVLVLLSLCYSAWQLGLLFMATEIINRVGRRAWEVQLLAAPVVGLVLTAFLITEDVRQ